MAQFIQRVCDKKKIDVTTTEIRELSWRFSGDTGNGRKESIQALSQYSLEVKSNFDKFFGSASIIDNCSLIVKESF